MVRPRVRDESPDRHVDIRLEPRQPDDPAVPPVVHPGDERFPPALRFTREEDRRDRDDLLTRRFAPLRPLSWDTVQTLQLSTRATELLGPHWRAFFAISESVCADLAVEFFSTIHLRTPLYDYAREDAITFRLGGVERSLSLRQFAVHMGLYPEADLDTPAFTEGITSWPSEADFIEFWREVGTGPYSHPLPKSTAFRDPLHRIIHRAIAHSIAPRSSSAAGNITRTDLLYLYCMVRSIPCQIAERLARLLFQTRRDSDSREIYGGGYVLRLAKSMGIMSRADFEALPTCALPQPIDSPTLVRMGVAKKVDRSYILLGRDGRPYLHRRAHDHEAGSSGHAGARPSSSGTARGDAGASGSGGGGDQAHTTTDTPMTETPDAPPFQVHESISGLPHPPQPTGSLQTYSRDHLIASRLRRLEEAQAEMRADLLAAHTHTTEMLRLQFAHAEAHRSYITSMVQLLAADYITPGSGPRPPVIPPQLLDFIRGGQTSTPATAPAPDADPTPDPDHPGPSS